jgi:hypothetical protein
MVRRTVNVSELSTPSFLQILIVPSLPNEIQFIIHDLRFVGCVILSGYVNIRICY